MKTTQRNRFKRCDLDEMIEWATPIGQITFAHNDEDEDEYFAQVVDSTTDKVTFTITDTALKVVKVLNKMIYEHTHKTDNKLILTTLEKQVITFLKKDYERNHGHQDNTDIYAVVAETNLTIRVLRGVLSSLIQKEVVEYWGNDPRNRDCFCPIFKGKRWIEAKGAINQ